MTCSGRSARSSRGAITTNVFSRRTKTMLESESQKTWTFDYSPAPESSKIVKLKPRYELFIGGRFVAPKAGKYFKTLNPATGETLAEIAEAGASDVDSAVKAADKAFASWSKLSGRDRGRYLFRIARIIQERSRELAV